MTNILQIHRYQRFFHLNGSRALFIRDTLSTLIKASEKNAKAAEHKVSALPYLVSSIVGLSPLPITFDCASEPTKEVTRPIHQP